MSPKSTEAPSEAGRDLYEYDVVEVSESPRKEVAEHAAEGWRLASMTRGYFDRNEVWREVGYTIVFERPALA